jgi:hypothetical protein
MKGKSILESEPGALIMLLFKTGIEIGLGLGEDGTEIFDGGVWLRGG